MGPMPLHRASSVSKTLPIIFLTGHGDFPTSVKVIKAGAEDFLAKPARRKVLLETIERALQRYDDRHEQNVRLSAHRAHLDVLTPRERVVLKLIAEGHQNKRIATYLSISVKQWKSIGPI